MNILICDDEEKYLNELKIHIEEYIKNHYIVANIITTTSAHDVLNYNDVFNLAFLDIEMSELDGISLAKELKKRNNKIILFFITNFDNYQDQAMDLHIFRFFQKPIDISRLYKSLDRAFEYLDETYVDIYLYKNGEHKQVLIDDIMYIARENRQIIIQTTTEKFITKKNLDEWIKELPNTYFYSVHKSFIINLHYVTKYNYKELYLNNDIRIPIAPRRQSDFHHYWFDYLTRR